ncbi:MAG: glycosyltransferase family 2 protein [Gallionella sp.]|nr:glycosyltransferase family 2 protein [Gallionella sp.]
MTSSQLISVVIPVYRAENCLNELCQRLLTVLPTITPSFEILFVEDCGGDNSWDVIQCLAKQDVRIRGVRLSRNFGQHAATLCGMACARGEWVVTIDDDLEQLPEDIPDLYLKAIQEEYSLVYAVFEERTHSLWRNVTSIIARKVFAIAIPSLNYSYSSFRIIHNHLVQKLCEFTSPFPFVDGYLSWICNQYGTVKVTHGVRKYGGSNYNMAKLIAHTMHIFFSFSELPLRIASWLGVVSAGLGFLWMIWAIVGKMTGLISVSGYASVIGAIAFFSGVQLMILGVVGQYISRINFKTSNKPLYLIREDTNFKL